MKTCILFVISIFSTQIQAQNLEVKKAKSNIINHTFYPGDKVFIKQKGNWAYESTAFYRTENDSVFFRNDSCALSDIKRIIPEKSFLHLPNGIFSVGEIFGSAIQVTAVVFGAGNSLNGKMEVENFLWGYGTMCIIFAQGTSVKYASRGLKNSIFSCFKYSSDKYIFMAN